MSYIPIMYHTCLTYTEETKEYTITHCKACKENQEIKKAREQFEDMTRTTIEWSEESVLL